jgi:hypothetical protein
MQNTYKSCLMIVMGLFSIFAISSCFPYASALLIGGKVVKEYVPRKILVAYEPQGPAPPGAQFYLIETDSGLAFYTKDPTGGIICEKHWVEGSADYFAAAWFGNGPAFIFKVPMDRTQNAERYVYENLTYKGTPGDRMRPMPVKPKEKPDTLLIPKNIYDPGHK